MSSSTPRPPGFWASCRRGLSGRPGPPGPTTWAAALALAVVVGLATTDGAPGIAASPLGLISLGAACLLLVVAARTGRSVPVAVALILLGAAAGQDLLRDGVAVGHDIESHAWGVYATGRSVLDGELWPRWTHYLGLGMPLLQFYSPAGYALSVPLALVGVPPVAALEGVLLGSAIAGAVSAFGTARWLGHSVAASAVAGAALALAPYRLLDQTLRMALGECLGLVLLPPVLAAIWMVARRGRGVPVLAAGSAALVLSHLMSVILVLFVGTGLVVAARLVPGPRVPPRRAAAGLVLAGLLGAGASAAWWLPMVAEQHHTSMSRVSGGAISPYAVVGFEPLRRRPWLRYDIRRAVGENDDPGRGMPMYLGVGLVALAALGAVARGADRRGDADASSAAPDADVHSAARDADVYSAAPDADASCAVPEVGARQAAASTAFPSEGVASPTPLPPLPPPSAWWAGAAVVCVLVTVHPLATVLDYTPLLNRIQFPWRLYAPATALLALATAGAIDGLGRRAGPMIPGRGSPPGGALGAAGPRQSGAQLLAVCAALALLSWDAVPYLGAPARWEVPASFGAVVGGKAREYRLPRGPFLRVEEAVLPPGDWKLRVGRTRVLFPEYLTPPLRRRYGFRSQPPSDELSESLGVWARIPRGGRPQTLQPGSGVRLWVDGQWRPVPATTQWRPEGLSVDLPPGTSGRLQLASAWFPGWQVRVDDGPWEPALRVEDLIGIDAPAASATVEARYSAWSPIDRPIGMGLTVATILGCVLGRRRLFRS